MKILNLENTFLNNLLKGLFEIFLHANTSVFSQQFSEVKTSSKLFDNFHEIVDKINEELNLVRVDYQRQSKEEINEENTLLKQNTIMRLEIEKLKVQNENFRNSMGDLNDGDKLKQLENELKEKERIIEQLKASNANIANEFQKLQQTITESSGN